MGNKIKRSMAREKEREKEGMSDGRGRWKREKEGKIARYNAREWV